jgi:large subunit ribosomal protein L20
MRVKRGNVARQKRKKVLKQAKGFTGSLGKLYGSVAKIAVIKAGLYAYRDRRELKRDMRGLWITRINAAARQNGLTYSELIPLLKKANIGLDRKMLADIAATDAKTFAHLVETVKK